MDRACVCVRAHSRGETDSARVEAVCEKPKATVCVCEDKTREH